MILVCNRRIHRQHIISTWQSFPFGVTAFSSKTWNVYSTWKNSCLVENSRTFLSEMKILEMKIKTSVLFRLVSSTLRYSLLSIGTRLELGADSGRWSHLYQNSPDTTAETLFRLFWPPWCVSRFTSIENMLSMNSQSCLWCCKTK